MDQNKQLITRAPQSYKCHHLVLTTCSCKSGGDIELAKQRKREHLPDELKKKLYIRRPPWKHWLSNVLDACCLYSRCYLDYSCTHHKLGYFSKCEGIQNYYFLHYWFCIQGNKQMQRNDNEETTAQIWQCSQGLAKQAEATWQAKRGRVLLLGVRKGKGSWAHNFLRGQVRPPGTLKLVFASPIMMEPVYMCMYSW